MPLTAAPMGRARCGAALVALLAGCGPLAPTSSDVTSSPSAPVTAATPAISAEPSSPRAFAIEPVERRFADVTALTSSGDALSWGSGAELWRFAPGDEDATLIHQGQAGSLVWDIAAINDALVFSERLAEPDGAWRVAYIAGRGAAPLEIDRGVAPGGAPPTVAVDAERVAWAGFDESSGAPETFLRVAERTDLATSTALIEASVEDRLLWYPQLDRDALWFSVIEPDFQAAKGGDRMSVASVDLADPTGAPAPFRGLEHVFEAAVSERYVAWKRVEPGLSALTWGELHVLDRASGEELVIPGQANHPTIGAGFVAFEELFHRRLLLFDLATRSTIELPDPRPGGKGTFGPAVVRGRLLGFTVSRRGETTVFWAVLPT